jgi:hypothetical protein
MLNLSSFEKNKNKADFNVAISPIVLFTFFDFKLNIINF